MFATEGRGIVGVGRGGRHGIPYLTEFRIKRIPRNFGGIESKISVKFCLNYVVSIIPVDTLVYDYQMKQLFNSTRDCSMYIVYDIHDIEVGIFYLNQARSYKGGGCTGARAPPFCKKEGCTGFFASPW